MARRAMESPRKNNRCGKRRKASLSLLAVSTTAAWTAAFAFSRPSAAPSMPSLQTWINSRQSMPVANSVLFFPSGSYATDVSYLQVDTGGRVQGLYALQVICTKWEESFESNRGDVIMQVERASQIDPTSLIVQWNITWVPPNAAWLVRLAEVMKWERSYMSYVDKSRDISFFSYVAVFRLFLDAIKYRQLRIPQATIQGTTIFQLKRTDDDASTWKIHSMREELGYAQDLKKGILKNRKCAQDLRLFLETARRLDGKFGSPSKDWDDIVAESLPWSTVPGFSNLEVEQNADDEQWVPIVFIAFTLLSIFGFAALLAPELIGQSMFGPPNYIVPPSNLDSI